MRALDAARRLLADPERPWVLASVLAFAALLQLALSNAYQNSVFANLLATVPLVLVRRRPLVAAWLITAGTWFILADGTAIATVGGLASQALAAYFVAARCRRLASVLLAVPFVIAASAGMGQGRLS